MNPRACLLVALLVSPAWSQEPVAVQPAPTAMAFDLNSASIRKIVRDTAANQYATVQLSEKSAVDPQPVATIKFVPEEKPPAPRRQTARPTPKPAPSSDGPFSSLFEVLVDELLGVEVDEVTASNEMLRCRVQKEQKTSPPGPDNCPSVY